MKRTLFGLNLWSVSNTVKILNSIPNSQNRLSDQSQNLILDYRQNWEQDVRKWALIREKFSEVIYQPSSED